jgi:hypothetical protein
LPGKFFESSTPSDVVVMITAAIGQIQEQAPLQYARRLAKLGIHAVTFDHRYFGLSVAARAWSRAVTISASLCAVWSVVSSMDVGKLRPDGLP